MMFLLKSQDPTGHLQETGNSETDSQPYPGQRTLPALQPTREALELTPVASPCVPSGADQGCAAEHADHKRRERLAELTQVHLEKAKNLHVGIQSASSQDLVHEQTEDPSNTLQSLQEKEQTPGSGIKAASAKGLHVSPKRVSDREVQLEEDNAQLKLALAEQSEHFTRLTRELENLRDSEQKLRAEKGAMYAENVACKHKLNELECELQQIRSTGERRRSLDRQQSERLKSLTLELQRFESNSTKLRSEVEMVTTENIELKQQLSELQERVNGFTKAYPKFSQVFRTGSSQSLSASTKARDEIDARLLEFLSVSKCPLRFRRVNRGWYQFFTVGVPMKPALAKHVEVSIVNGKLMMRMEASTHDPGWNGGRPGAVERFVAAFSS